MNMDSPYPASKRIVIIEHMLVNGWLEPLTPFERVWNKVRAWFRK
jgi:hypothetical protein